MLKIVGNDEMLLSNDCVCGGCFFFLVVFFNDWIYVLNYKLDRIY